ncbi:Cof subfamily protein (haloacid dehalogenase superfamily) [Breznakia sp. PF5-3]|uniref:HAD family hydrolase n=1 Tax=unclassified Breznakia TaxID=2623764 RepID=UPI0024067A68|nr:MULTISPECIES: HAD family hydrolase [unclassified Breznakia]MDF9824025.1 Cof subfamily protein (haloacid dehalogenase superfamily) [Breznakia sp. PM6-1]MDF9834824.1 Cof subfamily protein (haloacid dehalogenase superfamily) [Breznakia sp. PF5-3]MDF9838143.1 Cof subfamily protein (haloacid dehalogenase superfamily) [Breznakia sp. PFB2-8]MDF9860129.1 Cof subfamily protein (haloacid dehalogenase superfamily) [Breznakia sp. PH5-24]
MIKAICMDLDGTLLTSEKTISSKTQQGLKSYAKQGVQLILASGRTRKRMQDYADIIDLEVSDGKIIESNGVAIYDYEKDSYEVIRRMKFGEVKEIVDFLKTQKVEILIMGEENVFIILAPGEKESSYIRSSSNMEGLKNRKFFYIKDIDEINEAVNKVCVFENEKLVNELYEKLSKDTFKHAYWCGRTLPVWLEIGPASVSKGNALVKIMERYQWKDDEVIVFGDGENDLSMLGTVKNSVAMGNAMESVKAACAFECGTNDEDGIINFLKEKEEIL